MRMQSAAVVLILIAAAAAFQASSIPPSQLIQPAALAKQLQAAETSKPLVLQVGSRVLYQQAHIPGSEYVGPASTDDGLQKLRQRVASVPHDRPIVIYCGCCPWAHCPNLEPAADALRVAGFKDVKALYIANNFGTDWVDKGYPVAKGD
jgi:thiosulfate/3-mercaptopyruvate sulfurtransferase